MSFVPLIINILYKWTDCFVQK